MSVQRFDFPGNPYRLSRPLVAAIVVAIPLLIALAAGLLAFLQLRDALSFDQRALAAVEVQTRALRLQLDQQSGIRGYLVTGNRRFLEPYTAALANRNPALERLAGMTAALGIANGPNVVSTMTGLHQRWLDEIAKPVLSGGLTQKRGSASELYGNQLVDAYRAANRKLGHEIQAAVTLHRNSSEAVFVRIGLLFLTSIALGAIGIGLAARQMVRAERARVQAESLLRERELIYQQSRTLSSSLQRAILPPRLPQVPGCRLDAVYEPGKSDAQVGGDWYDAVCLLDGRILVSIGDVAGSGVEAAVVMGIVRQIMRGIAQVHANPALMLDAADRALRLEYEDTFVTAWVGVIDVVGRTLSYASAGHPPALLALPDGDVAELPYTSLPLGLREGYQDSATTVALTDGATLLLYTDGLIEATRDIIAGDRLVRAAARRIAGRPWAQPAQTIKGHILTKPATDDVAILAARLDFAAAERYVQRTVFDVRDVHAARAARALLQQCLVERNFQPIETLNAELVFGELIGNVLRHGGLHEVVEIALDCRGSQTVLHVLDRGPGFRHISRLPADPLSETGRGLFLIGAMTAEFTVNERLGGGSHVRAVLIARLPRSIAELPLTQFS